MAKINVPFDNKNYLVDEANFASSANALKSHLSSVMNGTGATINFGGVPYNVDSAKLTAARNAFVSHLGTVAGNGYKVVVNGVEYGVDSAKMTSAIAQLHEVLGGLLSGGEGGNDKQVIFEENTYNDFIYYDYLSCYVYNFNPPPFTLELGKTYEVVWDGVSYVCEVQNTSGILTANGLAVGNLSSIGLSGNNEPFAIGYDNDGVSLFAFDSATSHTVAIYKVAPSTDGERHDDAIPEGAYYANFNTMTFYDAMPETVSIGDVYLYGDYMYTYISSFDGWRPTLAIEETGIRDFIPDYPVTDNKQTSYGSILTSINGKNVNYLFQTFCECDLLVVAPVIPSGVINMEQAFQGCSSLITAPIIPDGVINMEQAFNACASLTGTIEIPCACEGQDIGYENISINHDIANCTH